MTEHQGHKPAGLWRRAAARFVDASAMAVIEFVMILVATAVAFLVAQPGMVSDENWGVYYVAFALLLVPASIPAYLFEVGSTVRSGQTWGKRLADIRVVRWDGEAAAAGDQGSLAHRRIAARWAIPHGAGTVAAVVAVIVVLPGAQDGVESGWVLMGAFAVPWALVYASSLWDNNGRGWHDKAAGTVVIDDRQCQGQTSSRSRPGPGSSETAPRQDSRESWGMVSDYYGSLRSRGADGTDERPSGTES